MQTTCHGFERTVRASLGVLSIAVRKGFMRTACTMPLDALLIIKTKNRDKAAIVQQTFFSGLKALTEELSYTAG